jgi:hypothetical protein
MLINTNTTTVTMTEEERGQLLLSLAELLRTAHIDITSREYNVLRELYMRLLTH